jgi:glycosyltransferase involved in cell wall biosynthesis
LNSTTIALIVARLTGITFSFTAHANDLFVNPILLPEKIRAARFIIAISEYNRAFLYNLVPMQETLQKTHVVHCGIDVDRFSKKHPAGQRPAGASLLTDGQGQTTIVAVGRLVEKKGYPYLIQACKILAARGIPFRCLIAGSGPQEAFLQQLIDDNGLTGPDGTSGPDKAPASSASSSYVQLLGRVFQEDLLSLLAQADVFCLPCVVAQDGDMDGIPNTLMEAMAMQIATISTSVSGIPELIKDGKTGLLVPPQDAESLADAIARLIGDQHLRTSLGQAARAHIAEQFEVQNNVRRLVEILDSYR